MQGEFIDATDRRWRAFLEATPHDVYHLPEYGTLSAQGTDSIPIAYLAEDGETRLLIPLLETRVPAELSGGTRWSDLASPYGYASPLLVGDHARFSSLLRGFAEACAERGSVAAFLRSHPLIPPDWSPAPSWNTERTAAHLVSRGETVFIDLTKSAASLRGELRTDHRRGIDRLLKRGYSSSVDDWSLYGKFLVLYWRTMERVQASSSYFFPEAYFRAIPELLRGRVHLISILDPEGEVVAGGLFFKSGDIIQYHLGGSDPAQMKLSPSKLSIHAATQWGQAIGARSLHLGGGLGAREDPLFWFKSGFSPLRRSYSTLGVLADCKAYAELLVRSGGDPMSSFFPAYRAPRPTRDADHGQVAAAAQV